MKEASKLHELQTIFKISILCKLSVQLMKAIKNIHAILPRKQSQWQTSREEHDKLKLEHITGYTKGKISMNKSLVKVKKEKTVSYLSLDSPENLNALGLDIVSDLLNALIETEADPGTNVVVINSSGKAFSAGGDLVNLNQQAKAQAAEEMEQLVKAVADVILYLKKMTKIVISSVKSAAAGAGFSLALASDVIIAADNAQFMTAFVSVGLVSDGGNLFLLSKAIGSSRALNLSLTGRPIKAEEALALGLVAQVVPVDHLDKVTTQFAEKLAQGPLEAYRDIKALNYTVNYSELETYLKEETVAQTQAMVSDQFIEGTDAFLTKRTPIFLRD